MAVRGGRTAPDAFSHNGNPSMLMHVPPRETLSVAAVSGSAAEMPRAAAGSESATDCRATDCKVSKSRSRHCSERTDGSCLFGAAAPRPVFSSLHKDVVSDGIPGVMNANEKEQQRRR